MVRPRFDADVDTSNEQGKLRQNVALERCYRIIHEDYCTNRVMYRIHKGSSMPTKLPIPLTTPSTTPVVLPFSDSDLTFVLSATF
jgi:hypothetical protein